MKTLVVYYTRTGHTRRVAEDIATALEADIEELKDDVHRGGPIGFVRSGMEARNGTTVNLEPLEHRPSDYDLVVVGTPVWAQNVSSPVRTFLESVDLGNAKVGWFCTVGASRQSFKDDCFLTMNEASGRTPVAVVGFSASEMKKDRSVVIGAFADELKRAASSK